MTLPEFKKSLLDHAVPPPLSLPLKALWLDARGDWEEAHRVVQDEEGRDSAWVHAYLHRKEGDLWNAGYWYRRAQQPVADDELEAEWERLVEALLA